MRDSAKRKDVCFSNLKVPHGVGHNAVCVCLCRWCVAEQSQATVMPQMELFANVGAAVDLPIRKAA